MFCSLFHSVLTQDAVVAFLQEFLSPFQHIPCVKSVNEQEPSKELDLGNTFGFPNPNDWPLRLHILELVVVVFTWRESLLPPNKGPNIFFNFSAIRQRWELLLQFQNSSYACLVIGILKHSSKSEEDLSFQKEALGSIADRKRLG